MSFRLPTIESKNKLPEQQDYNFVNKERSKKPPMPKEAPGLQLIEQLKRKVEQQKREIDTRNNTIMAIQRNFQSMSVLLKNEKLENTGIRDENDKLKKQLDEVGKRAAEFHERSLTLTNQVKRLKEELQATQEERRSSKKQQESNDTLKKIIADLEANVLNLSSRLIEAENEKKASQSEMSRLKSGEKQRRQLSQRLVDLEEELHKKTERVNYLQLEVKRNDDEIKMLKDELAGKDRQIEQIKKKDKDNKSKQHLSDEQIRVLRQQIAALEESEARLKQLIENKDVIIAVKIKAEDEHKQTLIQLKQKDEQLRKMLSAKQRELKETSQMLVSSLRTIEDKDKILVKNQAEITVLKHSHNELDAKLRQVQQQLMRVESTNAALSDKSTTVSQKMQALARESAALRQEKQQLQLTIEELRHSVSERDGQLATLNQIVHRYQQYESFITELEKLGGYAKVLSTTEYDNLQRSLQDYRREQQNLQRMIQQEKQRLEAEASQRKNAMRMLSTYQQEEAELRNIIDEEKRQLQKLASQKELKEQEVEQERTNNKLLWSDNKKLKQKELLLAQLERDHQQLEKKKAEELKELELKKQKELEKRASEIKEKYESELSELKRSISTNGQLSNILLQKSNHLAKLEQELSKTAAELDFYKNRNKELEGVVGRTQKRFKEAEGVYLQDNEKLRKESKVHSQMITALTDKIASLEKDKKQVDSILEMNKKLNSEVDKLNQHVSTLEGKLSKVNFDELDKQRRENDQKILAIRKSIEDLGESLTACTNNLNCCHCGQLPVDSVKLIPCGHVYCKKCKAGYDPNCGECKVTGQPHPDRVNDQTIKKFRFMQTILTLLRENTKVFA